MHEFAIFTCARDSLASYCTWATFQRIGKAALSEWRRDAYDADNDSPFFLFFILLAQWNRKINRMRAKVACRYLAQKCNCIIYRYKPRVSQPLRQMTSPRDAIIFRITDEAKSDMDDKQTNGHLKKRPSIEVKILCTSVFGCPEILRLPRV